MILTATQQAQKFPQVFITDTRISIQVKGTGQLTISRDQGSVTNAPNDGMTLTAASTSPPYRTHWMGELWYISNVPTNTWSIEILTI